MSDNFSRRHRYELPCGGVAEVPQHIEDPKLTEIRRGRPVLSGAGSGSIRGRCLRSSLACGPVILPRKRGAAIRVSDLSTMVEYPAAAALSGQNLDRSEYEYPRVGPAAW
jgi:hypothetical protein